MDRPILSHVPLLHDVEHAAEDAEFVLPSLGPISESEHTLRVYVPSMFIYYAADTFDTLH